MTKRELIDKTHLLEEIKKLQKSPWYNHGKNGMAIMRALYNERKEAVEVVRDLCINNEPVITEQEIFDKIRDEMFEEMLSHSGTGEEVIQAYASGLKKGLYILDKYKSESEG